MKKFWEDFKKFIKRGNVVDMAIGVAVASAFTAIVTAFTKGFINPLLALISPTSNQEELGWIIREGTLNPETGVMEGQVTILWGGFVQAIVNFLIVALTLFVIMRIVSGVSNRAKKFSADVKNLLSDEDEKAAEAAKLEAEAAAKAEAEAAAKAEAEAKAAEEAARAAEAAAKAAIEAEENRKKREEALLTEIRDLLKTMNK